MSNNYRDAFAKLRIFVSSTFQDLREHRTSVLESIHSLGSFTDDMIYWPADERDARTYSLERVQSCDLLILILAHRYGNVPDGEGFSITEAEYIEAKNNHISVIAFIIDDSFPWPPLHLDLENIERLKNLKREVRASHTTRTFTNPDNLARLVTEAVTLFVANKTGIKIAKFPPEVSLTQIMPRSELIQIPDGVALLGKAEDGLPLLLDVGSQDIVDIVSVKTDH